MNNQCNLSDAEIDDICAPLTQNAAKIRHLKAMGLIVGQKPNGKPLVNRIHYDEVTGGKSRTITNGPNWSKATV